VVCPEGSLETVGSLARTGSRAIKLNNLKEGAVGGQQHETQTTRKSGCPRNRKKCWCQNVEVLFTRTIIDIGHVSSEKKWRCACRLLGTSRLEEGAM
jgi:hypothetical protein